MNFTVRGSAITIDPAQEAENSTPWATQCASAATTDSARSAESVLAARFAVAIVMLSDENDCSIRDDGVGWFVVRNRPDAALHVAVRREPKRPVLPLLRAKRDERTAAGCPALTDDPGVQERRSGSAVRHLDNLHDELNFTLLQSAQALRLRSAVRDVAIRERAHATTLALAVNPAVSLTNPLYDTTGTSAPRDPSLVFFLAGIVGVPGRILPMTPPSRARAHYLTAQELVAKDRWDRAAWQPDR